MKPEGSEQRMDTVMSITEAYSIQPRSLTVGQTLGWPDGHIIHRILEEEVYIQGDPYTYYVGYSKDGKRLFEYKKGTVNVMFI